MGCVVSGETHHSDIRSFTVTKCGVNIYVLASNTASSNEVSSWAQAPNAMEHVLQLAPAKLLHDLLGVHHIGLCELLKIPKIQKSSSKCS
jgi:hypothetical protein